MRSGTYNPRLATVDEVTSLGPASDAENLLKRLSLYSTRLLLIHRAQALTGDPAGVEQLVSLPSQCLLSQELHR